MLLSILILLTTTAHLLTAGAASVGPLLVVWAEWRAGGRDDLPTLETARRMALLCVELLVVAFLLGGLLAGLKYWASGAEHFQPLLRFGSSRLWWGLGEVVVSLALMVAYWRYWDGLARRRWLHRLLAVFAATNLMYHFPFLFAASATLAEREPGVATAVRFSTMLGDLTVVARASHQLLAGAGAAGMFWALIALRRPRGKNASALVSTPAPESETGSGTQPSAAVPSATRVAAIGGKWALFSIFAQFAVGTWLMTRIGPAPRDRMLGGDSWSAIAALVAICAALLALHHAAAVAFGGGTRAIIRRMALLLVLTFAAMTVATYFSRGG